MCRFLVYKGRDARFKIRLSDLIVNPIHSIIHQSFDCRERLTEGVVPAQLNADGTHFTTSMLPIPVDVFASVT